MNPTKLSKKVTSLISDVFSYEEILLSAISLWELCKMLEKGRISISSDPESWMKEALSMPKLRVVQLTPAITCHSTTLPGIFHDDPADQIITATARLENAVLMTKDKGIQDYKYVKTIW